MVALTNQRFDHRTQPTEQGATTGVRLLLVRSVPQDALRQKRRPSGQGLIGDSHRQPHCVIR